MKQLVIILIIALCGGLAAEPWDITSTDIQQITSGLNIDRCEVYHLDSYDYLAMYSYNTDTGMAVESKVIRIDESGQLSVLSPQPSVISATSGTNMQVLHRFDRRFLVAWQDDAGVSYITEATMAPANNMVYIGPVFTLDAGNYVDMNMVYLGGELQLDYTLCNFIAADGSAQAMLLKVYLASNTIEVLTTQQIASGPVTSISTIDLVGNHLACAYTTNTGCHIAFQHVDIYTPSLQITLDEVIVPQPAQHCALTQLDEMSYAVVYEDANGNGAAVRFMADPVLGGFTPGPEMPLGFAVTQQPQLKSLGDDGVLCFCPDAAQGAAKVITIDAMQNCVTLQSEYTFDATSGLHPVMVETATDGWLASWTNPTDPDAGGRCMVLDVEPMAPAIGTVQGTITDALTGEPIENVEICDQSGVITTTDTSGMYSFEYVTGDYYLLTYHVEYQEFCMFVHVYEGETWFCDVELMPVNNPTVAYLNGFVYEMVNGEQVPVSQAEIYFDGVYNGVTSPQGCFNLEVEGGDHQLTLSKANYQAVTVPVTTVLGDTLHVEVEMSCQNMDTGIINGHVFFFIGGVYPLDLQGAEISIADSVHAISDENGLFSFEMPVGTYEVHCTLDNFYEVIDSVVVMPGETASMPCMMEEVDPLLGVVGGMVFTEIGGLAFGVSDAEIYLGDECIAVSDNWGMYYFVLEAGTYVVRVTAPGYEPIQDMVEVVAATQTDYNFFLITTDAEEQLPTPAVTLRNYPNPFNPTTTIQFSCPDASCTELALQIFNARGQKVRTLHINQSHIEQGCISWDGTDATGKTASSGLYFYRLLNGTKAVASSKMLLMK